jgi:hypothetical protein
VQDAAGAAAGWWHSSTWQQQQLLVAAAQQVICAVQCRKHTPSQCFAVDDECTEYVNVVLLRR